MVIIENIFLECLLLAKSSANYVHIVLGLVGIFWPWKTESQTLRSSHGSWPPPRLIKVYWKCVGPNLESSVVRGKICRADYKCASILTHLVKGPYYGFEPIYPYAEWGFNLIKVS